MEHMIVAINRKAINSKSKENIFELIETRETLEKILNRERVQLDRNSNLYLWLMRSPLSTLDEEILA